MKNLLKVALFCFIFSASKVIAQYNITWTIKDNLGKGVVKTMTVFNSNYSGFSNKQEAIAFCQKLKTNPEVASCDIVSNSGTNCDVKMVMKQPHDNVYYIALAQKLNVAFIHLNGQTKTPTAMMQEIRGKHK